MTSFNKKPIKRSKIRRTMGRLYYSCKRFIHWYFGKTNFAHKKEDLLKVPIFQHQSILLRKLKNVDMWLQFNKINNLRLATEAINRIVLHPGETFSFWFLIGMPSSIKGYMPGMVLEDGKVKSGIGGGLCQLSNLIFWMTLHTPLEVIERHRHSFDVFPDAERSLPFGSGATVAYNYIDLQIKNNTPLSFQLVVYLDDTHLHGEWRSEKEMVYNYQIVEKDHKIQREYWGGFTRKNTLYRQISDKKTGKSIAEEFLYENHAIMMYTPLLEHKTE